MGKQTTKTFGMVTDVVKSSVRDAFTLCMADTQEVLMSEEAVEHAGLKRHVHACPFKIMYNPIVDDGGYTWARDVELVTAADQESAVQGLRYNAGKLRVDAIPPQFTRMIAEIMTEDPTLRIDLIPKLFLKELAIVFTVGSEKYPARNWEKGMPWSDVIGPLSRHWLHWLEGKTRDKELPRCHHLALLAWNAAVLMDYERSCPELDNRAEMYPDWPPEGEISK